MKLKLRTTSLLAALLACTMLTTSCSAITTLTNVINTVDLLLPILEASGVPVPPIVLTAVTDVAQCVAGQSGATGAQLLAIAACLSAVIAPSLPPGTDQTIANLIATLFKDISAFLQQHPAPVPAPGVKPHALTLSASDAATLVKLEARATAQLARLKVLHAKQPVPPAPKGK